MNILLVGSGGREHALALSLSKSESCGKLYSYPGNPGIWKISEKVGKELKSHSDYINFCKENSIDLVVIGPEQPLADGLSDSLRQNGIAVFGPSKLAARLESSKGFAKDFMLKYKIPTASYKKFNKTEQNQAIEYLRTIDYPIVIKADGLAAGKGVIITHSFDEAQSTLYQIFSGIFGEAGNTVVIEEFMEGEEASILAVTDGKDYLLLPPSQDHKRIFDGDKGKNTGGMGAYAPAPIVNDSILKQIENEIIIPAINGMSAESTPFQGCLYAGLMIKDNKVKVVEFNVRLGDPETQAVLPLIEGDFAALLYSAAIGKLDKSKISILENKHCCCVVLASDGYPDNFEKGFEISGIDSAEKSGALVFHAGTALKDNKLVNSGGRVLGVTALGESLKQAIEKAYEYVELISFKNKYYRKDIGLKGLKKNFE
ncbi:MAG: phosphoribosylamine--glycine ligase [Candidatus Kapabacteria bacterium]|nr:phosphoribosylamine--glycine ligase [Candidatus Kapabacteria bacterium]